MEDPTVQCSKCKTGIPYRLSQRNDKDEILCFRCNNEAISRAISADVATGPSESRTVNINSTGRIIAEYRHGGIVPPVGNGEVIIPALEGGMLVPSALIQEIEERASAVQLCHRIEGNWDLGSPPKTREQWEERLPFINWPSNWLVKAILPTETFVCEYKITTLNLFKAGECSRAWIYRDNIEVLHWGVAPQKPEFARFTPEHSLALIGVINHSLKLLAKKVVSNDTVWIGDASFKSE